MCTVRRWRFAVGTIGNRLWSTGSPACVCRPPAGIRRGGILIPLAFAGCLLHVGRGLRPPPRMSKGRGSELVICGGDRVPALQGCVCRPSVGIPRRGGISIPPAVAGYLLHVGRGLRPPPRMSNVRGSALVICGGDRVPALQGWRFTTGHPTPPPYAARIIAAYRPTTTRRLSAAPNVSRRSR